MDPLVSFCVSSLVVVFFFSPSVLLHFYSPHSAFRSAVLMLVCMLLFFPFFSFLFWRSFC
ncbi:hypothetical protein V8C44DRAFT_267255 [Trichoderma aethiopicum]